MGNEETIYFGIKQSKMKIPKEVYDALSEWRSTVDNWADIDDIPKLPDNVKDWCTDPIEGIKSDRLIAIINFSDYVDTFEVVPDKKWVVRSENKDENGEYVYFYINDCFGVDVLFSTYYEAYITKFDTKEEAESWANAHQEVIEIEAE